jgi:hypothetical protein
MRLYDNKTQDELSFAHTTCMSAYLPRCAGRDRVVPAFAGMTNWQLLGGVNNRNLHALPHPSFAKARKLAKQNFPAPHSGAGWRSGIKGELSFAPATPHYKNRPIGRFYNTGASANYFTEVVALRF